MAKEYTLSIHDAEFLKKIFLKTGFLYGYLYFVERMGRLNKDFRNVLASVLVCIFAFPVLFTIAFDN